MKQLLKKEWREQFKFALLGLAIFSLLLVLVVRDGLNPLRDVMAGSPSLGQTDGMQPLLSSEVLAVATFTCAIFGIVLGWLQIHAERHPDLRAFLLHRPVVRASILQAKWLAGVALYSVAIGLPLTALLVYVLIPGHTPAPFDWAMVLPSVAVFLTGFVYYQVGMLTALRPARWYGSRIFGLGLALVSSFAVFAVIHFWQSLAVSVGAGLVLSVAVWGAFETGGSFTGQRWPSKTALSLACVASCLLLCALVAAIADKFLQPPWSYRSSYFAVTRDGGIYQVTTGGFEPETIVDLNGHPMLDPETGKAIQMDEFNKFTASQIYANVNFHRAATGEYSRWHRYYEASHFFVPWRLANKTLWYLDRSGCLVGYDAASRRLTGTLQPDNGPGHPKGFSWPPPSDDNDFAAYSEQDALAAHDALAADQAIYRIDLQNRSLAPILTVSNSDKIGGFSVYSPLGEFIAVTRNSIVLMHVDGQPIFTLPCHPDDSELYDSQVIVSPLREAGSYAVNLPEGWSLTKFPGKHSGLIELIKNGEVVREQPLPRLPEAQFDSHVGDYCSLIFSPAARLSVEHYFAEHHRFDRWDGYSFIPAVLSALAGLLFGRRIHAGVPEQAAWFVFNLIFGVAGVLAMVAVEEWPARETCPKCRQSRRVDRDYCEHCGVEFPHPQPNGTEIFETVGAV